VVYDMLVPVI